MSETRIHEGTSLWWNGASGGMTYKGEFLMWWVKPPLPLIPDEYSTIVFTPSSQEDNYYMLLGNKYVIDQDESEGLMTLIQKSFTEGGNQMNYIQANELIDIVHLEGTGYKPARSILTQSLIAESDGTPAVLHRLVSYGEYSIPASPTAIKSLNLKVTGMLGNGTQYAFCDRIAGSGITKDISDTKIFEYRTNFAKRQTNDLQFVVKATKEAASGMCEFIIEFTLPNQDFGLGVPFPDFPTSYSDKHKVLTT
ncbi:MAG: hypothetical protein ACRDCE_20375 [Cetobacterium sp.]|uniref:hypothetical protein n=1 Tax=Cetobacterium sp. TaxID=2071632 RepID=UPI003EE618DF